MRSRRVSIGGLKETLEGPLGWHPKARAEGSGKSAGEPLEGWAGRARRWGRVGVWTTALLAGLLVIGFGVVNALVDSDETAAWAGRRASAALSRDVTVGGARVAFLPRPGLRLDDVRVAGGLVDDQAPLAVINRLHLGISLPRLLLGEVRLVRADIDRVDVHLAVDGQGLTNFGDFVPEQAALATLGTGRVSVQLRELGFADAMISYFDGLRGRSFALAHMGGAVHVATDSISGWRATASGSADSLHLFLPALREEALRTRGPAYEVTLRGSDDFDGIEIVEGRFGRGDIALSFAGRASDLSTSDPLLDLRLQNQELPAEVLAAFLSAEVRSRVLPTFEGTIDMDLTLEGALGDDLRRLVRGAVRLDGVALRLAGEPIAEEVMGVVRVGSDSIGLDSLQGTFASGPVAASGIMNREARSFRLTLSGSPDLSDLDRTGLAPERVTLAGHADGTLVVSGVFDALDAVSAVGEVRLTGVKFEHEQLGAPLYLPTGVITVDERGLTWPDLPVLVGEESVVAGGSIHGSPASWLFSERAPTIDLSVTGPSLDLDRLLGPDGESGSKRYTTVALAQLKGAQIEGMRPAQVARGAGWLRPKRASVLGRTRLDFGRVVWQGVSLDSVSARIESSSEALTVAELEFAGFGGSATISASLGIGDGMDEPFEMAVALTDVDVEHLTAFLADPRATQPDGQLTRGALTGRADLWAEVAGTMDLFLLPFPAALTARGDITLRDGRVGETALNLSMADFLSDGEWADVPFTSWVSGFEIHEQRIDLAHSELDGELGQVSAVGAVAFGGAIDLEMGLTIPAARLGSVSLRRTGVAQSMIERLRITDTPLDLGVRVSGTLGGPVLEPDALAAERREG